MRIAVYIILAISTAVANAQFGIGLSPGSSCGNQFGPSRQAFNGQDEVMNLNGQLEGRNRRIEQLRAKESRLNEYISRAKSDMAQVITAKGFAAIREHRERRNSYGSYSLTCGGGRGSAPAVNDATDPELFSGGGARRSVDEMQTQVAPPDAFCVTNPATGQRENLWEKFVEDDGTVSDRLCDFRIAEVTRPANRTQRERCHEGMHEYYERMAEKARLRDEIARLDAEARGYERRLERIQDEITEGTYCPWCQAQRRGYSNMGAGNSMMQGVGMLAMLGMSLMQQQQRRPPPPPPPMMMGRPMFGAPVMPYGPPGYPMRPYTSQIPGYYGVAPGPRPGMGTYGGLPGGIGPGAFGCQGANPAAFGSPFGSPMVNPIYGGASPFNNPYASPMINPMFNQGAGPGWGYPMYGNGVPAFQDPYGYGPFGSPYNQNMFASPFAQNPFGNNPFAGPNPYGPNAYGNPYGALNPYGPGPWNGGYNPYDPYASNPWMNPYGGYNPYGANPYGPGYPYAGGINPYGAPAFMPYTGMNPYGAYGTPYGPGYGYGDPSYNSMMPPGGIPNYGYQNPWGAPLGSPLGSYLGQVNMLNTRMQLIQNGSYYGGGTYAPPVMPYLSTPMYNAPVYNSPGTIMNPGPIRGTPPAVLPYSR